MKIFCEMGFKYFSYRGKNRRPSPKEIARKLGLDEKTVRSRTKKMEREGFIQYYQAIPNPFLFGLPFAYLCYFQEPDLLAKQRALQKLRETDGLIDIGEFIGERFGVTVAASSEVDALKRIQRLARIIGISHFQILPLQRFSAPEIKLDKLDWQLVRALRYGALRPTQEVASELGITYRMTDYRITKLLESKTLFVRAMINASDPRGVLFYSLNLSVEESLKRRITRELSEAYRERLFSVVTSLGPDVILNLFTSSIGEVEDNLLKVLSLPGIRTGSLAIFKNLVEPSRPNWIDKIIEEKISTH